MTDEPDTLICMPGTTSEIPGCTPDTCSVCQAPVTVAPSGRRLLAQYPAMKIVCMTCANTAAEHNPDLEYRSPTLEQIEEILNASIQSRAKASMPPYADLAELSEDARIDIMARQILTGRTIGFFVDPPRADYYLAKLKLRIPGLQILERTGSLVPGTLFIKVAAPTQ